MFPKPSRSSALCVVACFTLLSAPCVVLDASESQAVAPPAGKPTTRLAYAPPPPTFTDVPYGRHPKHLLHFWKADTDRPTALIVYIHGGAWTGGDRYKYLDMVLPHALQHGISVASVEYRFIAEAKADGEVPPIRGPMVDCARAIQFLRHKAEEWGVDKNRIAACGGSARFYQIF